MTEYHETERCASCGGPLEEHRDAICCTCCPDGVWEETAGALQEAEEEAKSQ